MRLPDSAFLTAAAVAGLAERGVDPDTGSPTARQTAETFGHTL